MTPDNGDYLAQIRSRKVALEGAIQRGCSLRWQLRLWSRFIKVRDQNRCLCCEQIDSLQAHHIVRKTLLSCAALDGGNGISLCRACHRKVHLEFNRKPNPALPMGASQGDDQDEWSFLFGMLMEDANRRELPHDEFYYLKDDVLDFSVSYQGYPDLLESVESGNLSRLRFMQEIWRAMPELFYKDVAEKALRLLFES